VLLTVNPAETPEPRAVEERTRIEKSTIPDAIETFSRAFHTAPSQRIQNLSDQRFVDVNQSLPEMRIKRDEMIGPLLPSSPVGNAQQADQWRRFVARRTVRDQEAKVHPDRRLARGVVSCSRMRCTAPPAVLFRRGGTRVLERQLRQAQKWRPLGSWPPASLTIHNILTVIQGTPA